MEVEVHKDVQYPADSIPSREVRDDAELDLTHVKREAGERAETLINMGMAQ